MISYLLYRTAQFIVCNLPHKQAYAFSEFIASILYLFSPRNKKVIRANLSRVLKASKKEVTRAELNEMSREVHLNFGRYLCEFFRLPVVSEKYFKEQVEVVGLENVDKALSEGKGLITLTAHLGNWELGAVAYSKRGYDVSAVTLRHQSQRTTDFFDRLRRDSGVEVIPAGIAIKKCFEILRENKTMAFVIDKAFFGNGVVLNFMEEKALIPKGAAVFSIKTQAPVIPSFCIRQPDNTLKLIFEKPIKPPVSRKLAENEIKAFTRQMIKPIEDYIKRYPTQWLMFHKIWDE